MTSFTTKAATPHNSGVLFLNITHIHVLLISMENQEQVVAEARVEQNEHEFHEERNELSIPPSLDQLARYQSHELSMIEDLARENFGDAECFERYGVSREVFFEKVARMLRVRENDLYRMQFADANPSVTVFDPEKGLYMLQTSERDALYGSLYSIVDANPSLEKMRSVAYSLRSGLDRNGEIPGHAHFRSTVVMSGSFAQREVHPHPADFDFAEHLFIDLERNEDFAPHLAGLILDPIQRSAEIPELDFREMKYGEYPDVYGKEYAKKPIWWSPDEITQGEKIISLEDGNTAQLPFHLAGSKPGMIKINWISFFEDELKELTKVVNVSVFGPDGKEVITNRVKGSAFQEVYFDDVQSYHLTELVANPAVFIEYRNFLKKDIAHYIQSDPPNYLKAAKRAYALLKISGLFGEARKLSRLFDSPAAELAARADSLSLLSTYVKQGGKFEFPRLAVQAEKVGAYFAGHRDLFTDEELTLLMEATGVIKDKLLDGATSPETLSVLVDQLEWRCRQIVNQRSMEFIIGNETMNRLLGSAHK